MRWFSRFFGSAFVRVSILNVFVSHVICVQRDGKLIFAYLRFKWQQVASITTAEDDSKEGEGENTEKIKIIPRNPLLGE